MSNAFTIPDKSSITVDKRQFPRVIKPQKNMPQIVLKGSSKYAEPEMMTKLPRHTLRLLKRPKPTDT